MSNQIVLKFAGSLAPNDQITARTLSHSLQSLQRAIDKVVIYETRHSLKKFDSLSSTQYREADFLVQQFEPGCIQIPLLNNASAYIASRLRGILREPYDLAASQQERLFSQITSQLPAAYNRAIHANPDLNTQENLIENPDVEREYSNVAILKDLNQLISPIRSSRSDPEDSISLKISDRDLTSDYVFNKITAQRFNSIITSKKLGPETVYRGLLTGLEKTKFKDFPFAGKFVSLTTNYEMKLLIHTEEAAHALSRFNLSSNELLFWGAPLTTYGSFDEVRGDIVFIEFL